MIHIVIGLSIIAVGATVASWLFNSKTATEQARHDRLSAELSELQEKYDLELSNSNSNLHEIAKENYEKIKDKYLKEVRFFKKEKEGAKEKLEELANSIRNELRNESISAYQRQSLIENRNKVEDAKNRLEAYWIYLDWYKDEISSLEKYKKYEQIFDLELPQPLLPTDYLYLGKLASVSKIEDEIALHSSPRSYGWNRYGQRISLKTSGFNAQNNEVIACQEELSLYEEYENDEDFYILIDHKNKSNKFFQASIVKGLVYRHILADLELEVRPVSNERPNQEELLLSFNNVDLKLKRQQKLYPHKKYKEYDSFEVKVEEYDLLLNEVYVTEKVTEDFKNEAANILPIIFKSEFLNKIKSSEDELLKQDFQVVSLNDNDLVLKIGNHELQAEVDNDKKAVLLKNIIERDLNKINTSSFNTPFDIQLVEESIYYDYYNDLITGRDKSFTDFITFVNEQLNYINYSSKTLNNDFDIYKKWQRVINYQIEDNSYELLELEYDEFYKEDYGIVFKIINLDVLESKIKDIDSRDATVEVGGVNLGFLDDYSIEQSLIKTKVDFHQALDILPEGSLFLKIKTYQAVLHKQKKALKDFSFSKMVNADLKQLLISPQLISYKGISEDITVDFKNGQLTENQQSIVRGVLNVQDVFFIQGPPGTGKTTIIKELIFQTLLKNRFANILIVSQQNVAVDNVLSGIYIENIELFEEHGHTLVRVAPNEDKIQYEEIKKFTVERWFERYREEIHNHFINAELNSTTGRYALIKDWLDLIYKEDFREIDNEIKNLLISKHQILGATCVGLANKSLGLDLAEFDIAIVDEAGRATLPELLIPILRSKKVILIGDHNQLPPTIDRKLLEKIEQDDEDILSLEDMSVLERSYFEELYERAPDSNKAMLAEQFRMPKPIGDMISNLFYDNKLKNGHIKEIDNFLDPENVIRWIDLPNSTHSHQGTSSYNLDEVNQIIDFVKLCDTHLKTRGLTKSIGIITPYSAQKNNLRQKLGSLDLPYISNMKIDTVDSFQGEQADIVIYSTVKTYGNISFLIDRKRLNVAISRTKENLIFVGNKSFFYNKKVKQGELNLFKEIIDIIDG
ncbi:AAA domain-containing protein [uncultured Psychrobacter sp.]|uniref:AAA domain-containing protein n=1 Tax=uncultured Psychrobacter sp. TaxID=259303 RepID=UPI0034590DED